MSDVDALGALLPGLYGSDLKATIYFGSSGGKSAVELGLGKDAEELQATLFMGRDEIIVDSRDIFGTQQALSVPTVGMYDKYISSEWGKEAIKEMSANKLGQVREDIEDFEKQYKDMFDGDGKASRQAARRMYDYLMMTVKEESIRLESGEVDAITVSLSITRSTLKNALTNRATAYMGDGIGDLKASINKLVENTLPEDADIKVEIAIDKKTGRMIQMRIVGDAGGGLGVDMSLSITRERLAIDGVMTDELGGAESEVDFSIVGTKTVTADKVSYSFDIDYPGKKEGDGITFDYNRLDSSYSLAFNLGDQRMKLVGSIVKADESVELFVSRIFMNKESVSIGAKLTFDADKDMPKPPEAEDIFKLRTSDIEQLTEKIKNSKLVGAFVR